MVERLRQFGPTISAIVDRIKYHFRKIIIFLRITRLIEFQNQHLFSRRLLHTDFILTGERFKRLS